MQKIRAKKVIFSALFATMLVSVSVPTDISAAEQNSAQTINGVTLTVQDATGTPDLSWSAPGKTVTEWWLWLGTTKGGTQIRNTSSLKTATSYTHNTAFSSTASTWIRVWHKIGGSWSSVDFEYKPGAVEIQPSITVTSPNGGEKWAIGSTKTIQWNTQNSGDRKINLYLVHTVARIEEKIAENIDNTGSYSWTVASLDLVPNSQYVIIAESADRKFSDQSNSTFSIVNVPLQFDVDQNGILGPGDRDFLGKVVAQLEQCPASKVCDVNEDGKVGTLDMVALESLVKEYELRFDLNNNSLIDQSDSELQGRIAAALASCPFGKICDINSDGHVGAADVTAMGNLVAEHQPSITVTSPNGGEEWKIGETHNITWDSVGVDTVYIASKGTWGRLIGTRVLASLGKYSWTVPADIPTGAGYKIIIGDEKKDETDSLNDESDNNFSIVAPSVGVFTQTINGVTLAVQDSAGTPDLSWSAPGKTVTEWWLWIGTTKGGAQIRNTSSLKTATSYTLNAPLSSTASTWIRVWHKIANKWSSVDFEYKPGSAGGETGILKVMAKSGLENITIVEGQTDVLLSSYILEAGAAEGVNISSVKININTSDVGVVGALTNLKLKKAGTQIGATISSPITSNTFTTAGELNIPASREVQVDVYADFTTAASDGDGTKDMYTGSIPANGAIGVGAASGKTMQAPDANVITRTVTAIEGGTLIVSSETIGAPVAQILTPQLSDVEMLRFKLSATSESVKVNSLEFSTTNGIGNIATVKLLGTGLASDPVAVLTGDKAVFSFASGNEITVSAYSLRVIRALVATTPVGTLTAGKLGNIRVSKVQAFGASSGISMSKELKENENVENTMRFEEVEPIITLNSNSPQGNQIPGVDQTIAVFGIKTLGYRDIVFNRLTIEKFGSNNPAQNVANFSLWRGSEKIATEALGGTGGSQVTFLTNENIVAIQGGDQTAVFAIKADTTNVAAGLALGQTATFGVRIPGNKGPFGNGGLQWVYNPLNTAGTVVFQSISDSYPVEGNTLIYAGSGITQPSVTVTSPNGGEALAVGKQAEIRYNAPGFEYVIIALRQGSQGTLKRSLTYGGTTFKFPAGNNQAVQWTPIAQDAGEDLKLEIKASVRENGQDGSLIVDMSDGFFKIVDMQVYTDKSLYLYFGPGDSRNETIDIHTKLPTFMSCETAYVTVDTGTKYAAGSGGCLADGISNRTSTGAPLLPGDWKINLTVTDSAGERTKLVSPVFKVIQAPTASSGTAQTINGVTLTVQDSAGTPDLSWSAPDKTVTEWWLWIGTTKGGTQIRNTGNLKTATSYTLNAPLSSTASTWIRVWHKIANKWSSVDFEHKPIL